MILIFFPFPLAFFLFRKIIWPLISFPCSVSFCFDAVSLILWFHYEKGANRTVKRGGPPPTHVPAHHGGAHPRRLAGVQHGLLPGIKPQATWQGALSPPWNLFFYHRKQRGLLSTSTAFRFKAGLCQTHVAESPVHPVFSR